MPNKCCVANCSSNYSSSKKTVPAYHFPVDQIEKQRWLLALPNKIEKVSKHMVICKKHWPKETEWLKRKRFCRPNVPPSIFDGYQPSMTQQTFSRKSRQVTKRGVLFEQRAALPDELETFNAVDKIPSWQEFCSTLHQQNFVMAFNLLIQCNPQSIVLLHIMNCNVEYSVEIEESLQLHAKRRHTVINVRDLLGFQWKLERYSQLEAVCNRLQFAMVNLKRELQHSVSDLRVIAQESQYDFNTQTNFALRQIELSLQKPNGRKYSSEDILNATRLYFSNRQCYNISRDLLHLPHPDTLKSHLGGLGTVDTYNDCREIIETSFKDLTGRQRLCTIVFDEVYVQPSLRLRGGHVMGYSQDQPLKLARTVLAFMIKPFMGGKAFVARLIPVHSLNATFLHQQLIQLITLVHECSGTVLSTVCDNHIINRQCYNMLAGNNPSPSIAHHPVRKEWPLYLLYDPTHLLKNFRNNWITEANQKILFEPVSGGPKVQGKWSDIVDLMKSEKNNVLRMTELSETSCHPSPIQRQKVSLVLKVFNEKTVAALRLQGKDQTATVVECVLNLWKILNVKSPKMHIYLNDTFRQPICSTSSPGLQYLSRFADSIEAMKGGRGPGRQQSLTTHTQQAFCQTLRGIVALATDLISFHGFSYVLLGELQSDELEGEFGVYRQRSGGCYFISVEQLLCSARFRRMQFYSRLFDKFAIPNHILSSCCTSTLTDFEVSFLDMCPEGVDRLSSEEHATIYYVCGYVCKKEGIIVTFDNSQFNTEHCQFTELVSRGRLSHPPKWLFIFAQFCYAYFLQSNMNCVTRLTSAFILIHDAFFDVPIATKSLTSITRRLSKCYIKGLVRRETELLFSVPSTQPRNLRKLQS